MKETIKQQWVTALRSNEYEQTVHSLHTSEGFCCLGVLCDLYVKETGDEWFMYLRAKGPEEGAPIEHYSFQGQRSILPEPVKEWSDLSESNPCVYYNFPGYEPELLPLAKLNDARKTFEEIADLIEAQL